METTKKQKGNMMIFIQVWLLHALVYYQTFGFLFHDVLGGLRRAGLKSWLENLPEAVLIYSLVAFVPIIDFGLFYVAMVIASIFFFGFKIHLFKAYYLSLVTCIVIWLLSFMLKGLSLEEIIKFYVPSAVVAIAVNWLVFRRTYRRLKEEDLQCKAIKK